MLPSEPIFIVGPHRAGSTLWHNVIAMSPGILRLGDARFLGRPGQKDFRYFLQTQVGDPPHDDCIDKMVELCFSRSRIPGLDGSLWRFKNLQIVVQPEFRRSVSEQVKKSNRTLGAIVQVIIGELTRFSHCSRACVKFPVYIRYIPELMRWFPDGKVVHITRDPRGLAMSKSNDPSGTSLMVDRHPSIAWLIRKAALSLVVLQYRLSAKVHRRMRGLENYRLFRYEDLLAEPENTLRDLCSFIGIAFSEDMLQPQKGRHEHQPSSLTGKQQKAFDAKAAIRWQQVISPVDNFFITLLTRSSMDRLGYDPGRHPIFKQSHVPDRAGAEAA